MILEAVFSVVKIVVVTTAIVYLILGIQNLRKRFTAKAQQNSGAGDKPAS